MHHQVADREMVQVRFGAPARLKMDLKLPYQRQKYYQFLLIFLIANCLSISAFSENGADENDRMTISGYVSGADDGEMLTGATIAVQGT
ncbi:MAG: hypothetical protein ACOC1E_02550, partial [Marinilabiliaceae bacterium]